MKFLTIMKPVRNAKLCKRQLSTYTSSIITFLERNENLWTHEMSLPRLPVPPLQGTLAKYLYSVRPFLSKEEYLNTTKIVNEFGAPTGLGNKLQTMLVERAKRNPDWSDEWQANTYFLENRKPLVCNSSPSCGVFYKNCTRNILWQAARFVAGILDFKKMIDNYTLPIQAKSDQPDDLMLYYKVFYTCRIPATPRDKLEFYGLDNEEIKHIVVIHNNQFFSVDVYDDDGNILNENQIEYQFRKVMDMSTSVKSPIGILTTLDRDKWAKSYRLLLNYDHVNRKSLTAIQRALLIVCIDEPVTDPSKHSRDHFNKQVIHGGTVKTGGNRWYDKPFQLVVGGHGAFGIIFENSSFDARPLLNLFKYVNDYSIIDSHDTQEFTFEDFGTDSIKYQNASPDSFIQMALQLTHYKIHNEIAAAYETASTSKFFNGRADCIRSTSIDSVNFCKEMRNKSSSYHAKAAALKSAIQVHQEHTHQTVNGMGIDRHFLGLRKIAEKYNLPTPELFLDPAYMKCSYFRILGNQIPIKFDISPHHGPLVPDGYTCLYNLHLSPIRFNISAQKGCHETSTSDFKEALRESLIEMKTVIDHSKNDNM